MAIQFARCEYVSRSSGGNACRKASYNQRENLRCERTGELFSFKERGGNAHHEILLPFGAHDKFKESSVLWNEVEICERRINSQLAKEFVLALPDDRQATLEDRVELTRRFSQIFVDKGVAVQMDIHSPHEGEKNWHAHLLMTTRRFSEDGLSFQTKKARDLDPVIRSGTVVEATLWGEIWKDLQNTYFEEKGYDLRVDPIGLIPQEHLGPVRMRHHLNKAKERAELLAKANEIVSQDPKMILEEITRTQSVFTRRDVEHILQKHVSENERKIPLETVLSHSTVIPLYHKLYDQSSPREKENLEPEHFTTQAVRSEEEKLVRFADKVSNKYSLKLSSQSRVKGVIGKRLSSEQQEAYHYCVGSGKNLSIIQGRAGVGKTYVLDAIRAAHAADGYRVLGLAPTHKVANDLKENGFNESKTCHAFLFAYKNNPEKLNPNTLVIVDEAGMLGTSLSVELFKVIKETGAKLILVGDDRQLSSVERGGVFSYLTNRYGSVELKEVRRQTIHWQKDVSQSFAEGGIKSALYLLEEHKAIRWNQTKEETISALLKEWSRQRFLTPNENHQMIAQRNVDVDALNQGARDYLKAQGKLGESEIVCSTDRGRVSFAVGDRIQLTKTDKEQNLTNGSLGSIENINPETKHITLKLDNGEIREVNPNTYNGLRHGYAATVYKTQGSTLDHVYGLHTPTANQATNYVALTRQTKSLSLYVSKEETSSINQLIVQMGRQDTKGLSLAFESQQGIQKRQEKKSFKLSLKNTAQSFFNHLKDLFHNNQQFYTIPKSQTLPIEKAEIVKIQDRQQKSLQRDPALKEIHDHCKKTLYAYLKDNNKHLTPQLEERIIHQSERAASFIFYAHTLKRTEPSLAETRQFLLRSKYELDRIPEIKETIIQKWKDKGHYNEKKDDIRAQMIAERRATIEGRIYLEAKQNGNSIPLNIAQRAAQELNHHHIQAKKTANELSKKQAIPENIATDCAKNILRHQEIHSQTPSDTQIKAMIQISKDLEKKYASPAYKEYASPAYKELSFQEIISLKQQETDRLLRKACLKSLEYKKENALEISSLTKHLAKTPQEKTMQRMKQKEMSY